MKCSLRCLDLGELKDMARNCGGRALRPLVSELEKIRKEREQYSLDPQNSKSEGGW